MGLLGIVVSPPTLDDDDAGLGKVVENLAVQEFVAELGVEALAVSVLPRTARFDQRSPGADRRDALAYRLHDLWTIVSEKRAAFVARHAKLAAVVDVVLHEVGRPDMAGMLGPKPNAGAVVQPEPSALGLLGWHLQASCRQIRSTRFTFTSHPASRGKAVMRRLSAIASHRLPASGIRSVQTASPV